MNYSEMSDGEINILACKALGKGLSSYCRIRKIDDHSALLSDNKTLFDPCNSWADAGPIIQENRICIVADGEEPCSLGSHGGHQWWCASSDCRTFQCNYQRNPLRAAMIVFLMMKEADNAN